MWLGNPHRRVALFVALVSVAPLACGSDDDPLQVTAPAATGASGEVGGVGSAGVAPTPVPADEQSEPDPVDEEQAITKTLDALLTDADADAACGKLVTERFVRRSYGDTRGCAAARAREKPASAARVSEIVSLPDGVALARVVPNGGVYGGQRLRAELVLSEGSWKVDRLRSNVPVGP